MAGQRSWLAYWPKSCEQKKEFSNDTLLQCAIKKYKKRIGVLQAQRKILGGLTVYRKYKVHLTGYFMDMGHPKTSFAQSYDAIDVDGAPSSEKELAKSINLWLSGVQKSAFDDSLDNKGPDLSVTLHDSDLPGILTVLISSLRGCEAMCIYDETRSYFLLAEQRPLLATDIFQGKAWQDSLAQIFQKQLKLKHPYLDKIDDVNRLKNHFLLTFSMGPIIWVDPTPIDHWNLSRSKFMYEFNFGELEKGSDEDSITIPWSNLRPWLTPRFKKILGF